MRYRSRNPCLDRGLLLVAAALALPACVGAGAAGGGPESPSPDGRDDPGRTGTVSSGAPPPEEGRLVGLGTLRQDDITLSVRSGELLIKVTPMADEIIRLTAPDTYQRLANLSRSHRVRAEARAGGGEPALFLVSVFSDAPYASFEPEDLTVMSHGRRFRPLAIQPVTPEWGTRRLEQRQTRIAVYVFQGGVDLESDLQVEYQMARDDGWSRILPLIHAERAKVRARGGTGL